MSTPEKAAGAHDGTNDGTHATTPATTHAATPATTHATTSDSTHDAPAPAFANTNRWSTRELVTMALMCAIGVLLSFVEFAIFPAAPYLKYDASAVVAMVCGFAFGPSAGAIVGVVGAVIHGLLTGNPWGALMSILVVLGFALPSAALYQRNRTMKGAIVALAAGVLAAIAMAIVGNLLVTPIYNGMPVQQVMQLIVPVLLPFNILKGLLNAVITLVVYKSISNLITPKKNQVVGR